MISLVPVMPQLLSIVLRTPSLSVTCIRTMFDGKSGYFTEATLTTQILTAITNAGYTAADFSLPLTDVKKAGKHLLTANDITKVSGTQNVDETFLDNVNAALGLSDNKKISTYYEGVSYYIARIKHFGDELTPWNSGEPTYGTGEVAKKKYLGRYGVVRNNWYELQVNSISNPGSPDVPEVNPDTPDDEDDKYYINCSVRILSWAKRVHGIDL